MLIEPIFHMVFAFIFLAWSANRLVSGASALASQLGVPPLLIGLTIVALATSAPEILVTITAAVKGNPALGVGNAVGSNIANICLVLGVTAIITPLTVRSKILRREYPILFLIMFLFALLMLDGRLGMVDGGILFLALLALMMWLIKSGIHARRSEPLTQEYKDVIPNKMTLPWAIFWLVLGLLVLLVSSNVLVDSAVQIARAMHISDLMIGLTIVAIGTSLPEIATSVAAALKGESDLAIGNIIGSNMFNLLAVVPFAAIIHPHVVETGLLLRDLPLMIGVTVALFVMLIGLKGRGTLSRMEGGLLVCTYIAYLTLLYFDA